MNRKEIITADLCGRLIHGVKCETPYGVMELTQIEKPKKPFIYWFGYDGKINSKHFNAGICISKGLLSKGFRINKIKSYLFPSLTEPITVAGYNDGKPFVPLIEIAKLCTKEDFAEKKDLGISITDNTVSYKYQDVLYEFSFDGCRFNYMYKWKEWNTGAVNQRLGFDLLNQWHCNYRLLPGEYIHATNEYA